MTQYSVTINSDNCTQTLNYTLNADDTLVVTATKEGVQGWGIATYPSGVTGISCSNITRITTVTYDQTLYGATFTASGIAGSGTWNLGEASRSKVSYMGTINITANERTYTYYSRLRYYSMGGDLYNYGWYDDTSTTATSTPSNRNVTVKGQPTLSPGDGYTFLGWSNTNYSTAFTDLATAQAAVNYVAGNTVSVGYSTGSTDVHKYLFAVWLAPKYTASIQYKYTDDVGTYTWKTVTNSVYATSRPADWSTTVTTEDPGVSGKSLIGWSETDGASTATWVGGDAITAGYYAASEVGELRVLYAVWGASGPVVYGYVAGTGWVLGTMYAYDGSNWVEAKDVTQY